MPNLLTDIYIIEKRVCDSPVAYEFIGIDHEGNFIKINFEEAKYPYFDIIRMSDRHIADRFLTLLKNIGPEYEDFMVSKQSKDADAYMQDISCSKYHIEITKVDVCKDYVVGGGNKGCPGQE